MGILNKLFGNKILENEQKSPSTTEYFIDIDPKSKSYSKAFKDFYYNHFINSIGLIRGETGTGFFNLMTVEEKEIAKRLVRQNLKLRQVHLFKASGILKDNKALPILYQQFKNNTDFSWLLTIGQAIWLINQDDLYLKLLRQLKNHPSDSIRVAHFDQVTDFKNEESIDMLLDFLNDKSGMVKSMALSKLNSVLAGHYGPNPMFESDYFLSKRKDKEFKRKLVDNLLQ